jgi:predicted metal-dependent hydrolase
MAFDWKTGPLAEGLRCYSTRRFFEAHEHWEAVWLTLHEPEKSFLQALIQITAAFHHLQRGNRDGAISLLRRSLRRLESAPAQFCSLQVEALCDQLRVWLKALDSHATEAPASFPEFRMLET